jgi:hypothetical protein
MWTRPRQTIQQIVDSGSTRYVIPLAALSGVSQTLNRASARNAGDEIPLTIIFIAALTIGPLMGLFGLYVGSEILKLTGRWIGGVADAATLRIAMAWSTVPMAWAFLLWIPELALFGPEMFTSEMPRVDASAGLSVSFLLLALVELVIGIWGLVVLTKSLGQVQGFSAWKALASMLLAVVLVVAAILLPVVIIVELAQLR